MAAPAQARRRDRENTTLAAKLFKASLRRFYKAYHLYSTSDEYGHWTAEEAETLLRATVEKESWVEANKSRIKATPKTKDLPVNAAAFLREQQVKKTEHKTK